jgi:hypothetical protein
VEGNKWESRLLRELNIGVKTRGCVLINNCVYLLCNNIKSTAVSAVRVANSHQRDLRRGGGRGRGRRGRRRRRRKRRRRR